MAGWPTRSVASGAVVLRPEGRLNMAAAPELREQLDGLVRAGSTRLVVDLSAVDSIDSSGLGALISGLKAARQRGGDLRVAAPGEQATAMLELTNLNRILKSYESPDRAFDEPTRDTRVLEGMTGPGILGEAARVLDETWSAHPEVSEDIRTQVGIATGEIVANIVEHAARGKAVYIRMEVSVLPDRVEVSFVDDGQPAEIELSAAVLPDVMAERGRGLALAKAVLAELSYSRSTRNNWKLVSKPFGRPSP